MTATHNKLTLNISFDEILTEEPIEGESFRTSVTRAVRREIQERIDRLIRSKSHGVYYIWQRWKIQNFEDLPANLKNRFDLFLSEVAPVVSDGSYHLHLFYDKRTSSAYWKLTGRSSVCKIPGRCKRISLKLDE